MRRFLLVLALMSMVAGCQQRQTYVGVYDFALSRWTPEQSVVFDFTTLSGQSRGDMRLALRYLPSASGKTVSLAVKITNENELSFVDTLSVLLTRGSGDAVRSQEIIVRKNIVWPRRKPHSITIVPDRVLSDVLSVSLEVDNATQ